MKRTIMALAVFVFTALSTFAQSPEGINYQAVARDGGGNIIANQSIEVRFAILSGSMNGTAVYEENHNVSTNDFGLFTLKIGEGDIISGDFSTLDWGIAHHFLQVEVDAGNGFVDLGTTQFMSVPYALYAKEAGNTGPAYTAGNGIDLSGNKITNTGDTDAADDITKNTPAAGDLSGTYPAPQVKGLQGNPVSANNPSAGQVLKWDGNSWAPAADNTGSGSSLWTEQGSDIYYTNGKVGIGTASPGSALDVEGMVQLTKGAKSFQMGLNATDQLEIKPSGSVTSAITIDDNGSYVGLFGGSPITANSQFDIHTDADATSYGGMFVGTKGLDAKPFYGYATANGARAWTYFDGSSEQYRINNAGDHLVVTKQGRVGIGTDQPIASLQVEGTFSVSNNGDLFTFWTNAEGNLEVRPNAFSDPAITVVDNYDYIGLFGSDRVTTNSVFDVFSDAGSGEYGGMFVNTSSTEGKPFYGYSTNGNAKAWTSYDGITGNWKLYNGGNRMTVTNDGKVGIGTDNFQYAQNKIYFNSSNYVPNVLEIESGPAAKHERLLALTLDDNSKEDYFWATRGNAVHAAIKNDGEGYFQTVHVQRTTEEPEAGRIYANGLPIAVGQIKFNGDIYFGHMGIKSVNKTGTGTYEVTLHNGWIYSPVINITCFDASGGEVGNYSYDNNVDNKLTVTITDKNGNLKDSAFSIIVYGLAKDF